MTDDPDDDQEPTGSEEFMEILTENREERREQVSAEWVETIREAGELYRETEAIEDVADDLDLPVQKTREALTVYRLIFQERSNSALKSARVGRAYFGLSRDVADEYDSEDGDESLKELLCEYVGALYLDHDIDEAPVGDPPDESTPPAADVFAELDTDNVFQLPTTASMVPEVGISDVMMSESEIASIAAAAGASEAIRQDLLGPLSASIGTVGLPEGVMAMVTQTALPQNMDALSKIIQYSGFFENVATTSSVLSGLAEAAKVSQPPASLFADIATAQSTALPTAAISKQLGGWPYSGIKHQPQSDFGGDDIEKEQKPETEFEDEEVPDLGMSPELHTGYPNWEARIAESRINSIPSGVNQSPGEIDYKTPVEVVYQIVRRGENRRWLSTLPPYARLAVIEFVLLTVAIRLGFNHSGYFVIAAGVIYGAIWGSSTNTETSDN